MTIENKRLAYDFLNFFSQGQGSAAQLAAVFTASLPSYRTQELNREAFLQAVNHLQQALVDFSFEIQDLVASADRVAVRWKSSGRHLGVPLQTVAGELPASGQAFSITGMLWLSVQDGQITHAVFKEDTNGLLRQLSSVQDLQLQEQRRLTSRRYFDDLMNAARTEVIPEIFTEDVRLVLPARPQPIQGHEGLEVFATQLRAVFPDLRFQVDDEVVENHRVFTLWSLAGTHQGPFLGIPASGRVIQDAGIDLFVFEGERIREIYINQTDFLLIQQLKGQDPLLHK
ncbi:ester cyclase [Deinococcus roseus]|uniref:Ester cyclase n=1 Tax=Deinococcus roseus TaxID=392414 RepID=A0ABQ2CUU3_9DEIO|nr:ester cyclase [Deinococcus roseus]GGJ21601.1 hypothetical protein GCM10008938_04730 [Deinococcus roseus]